VEEEMNICVVGTGYVGLVTGACFAEFGNPVTCVDIDVSKIEALERGEIPIYEPGLEPLVERNVKAGRLKFSTDLPAIARESLVVFIAVGTPQGDDGRADLSFVREVAKTIGENLNSYKVVVTKSTVPAGTGKMVRSIIEKHSTEDHAFSVASNPEFLREGSAIEDFMRPNRVVLGTEDEQSAAILQDLYRPLYLIETPIVVTTRWPSCARRWAPTSTWWPRAWDWTAASAPSSCIPAPATAVPASPRTRGPSSRSPRTTTYSSAS
jgi:UDPglucose 6-dehydrogenase